MIIEIILKIIYFGLVIITENMTMKILVISDLHVGMTARAKDFSTNNDDKTYFLAECFIDDFKELVKNENINATHILIAGDITNSGGVEEFYLAEKRIKDIAKILSIPQCNIYFVPGNHDGNWDDEKLSIAQGETPEKTRTAKYKNIISNVFFNQLLDNSRFSSYYEDPYSALWETNDLLVVGVNSSAFDSCDKKVKFGEVDLKCLESLRSQLNSRSGCERKLKILLTHHHPKNYTDRTFPEADLSEMKNAEDFLRFACENQFDFIVHGHKHIPRFDYQLGSEGYSINILSAGSFSAQLKDWHNGVANFIHLIEHHDFCPDNDCSRGKLTTWSYFSNHKWKQASLDRDHIGFEEFFGFVVTRPMLNKILKTIIEQNMNGKDYVKWKDILAQQPNLMYCNRKLLYSAIGDLANKLKYEIMPGKNDDFTLWAE